MKDVLYLTKTLCWYNWYLGRLKKRRICLIESKISMPDTEINISSCLSHKYKHIKQLLRWWPVIKRWTLTVFAHMNLLHQCDRWREGQTAADERVPFYAQACVTLHKCTSKWNTESLGFTTQSLANKIQKDVTSNIPIVIIFIAKIVARKKTKCNCIYLTEEKRSSVFYHFIPRTTFSFLSNCNPTTVSAGIICCAHSNIPYG